MGATGKPPRTIEWIGGLDGYVRLLDQTLLPGALEYRDCRTMEDVWEAIHSLRVRGAPAIGVAAAMGILVGLQGHTDNPEDFVRRVGEVCDYLATSRPTAVNLFWAIERMRFLALASVGSESPTAADVYMLLWMEAAAIEEDDRQMCKAIGMHGAALIADGGGVLTHCNAGSLATAGDGTALAVLYAAHQQGKRFQVYADETRPLLQGARLTAWELMQRGLDVTLICDSMAAQVMKEGRVQAVIVGADRIAANGDTANKIGTYGVAVLARAHGIPFHVAAPSSTFDLSLKSGESIPIEKRDPREVTHGFGKQTAPDGVKVYNPAFDVTPANLIASIITERGVIQPVTDENIRRVLTSLP